MASAVTKVMPKNVYLVQCGSFNPIHYIHLRNLETVRDYCVSLGANVVGGCVSPANDKYSKSGLLPSAQRLAMCTLAVASSDWTAEDWECSQPTYTRTLIVLRHYRQLMTEKLGAEVIPLLVCGADLLDSFNKPGCWIPEQMEEILSQYGVVCVERPGTDTSRFATYPVLMPHMDRVHIIPASHVNDLSSTTVRNLVHDHKSVKYLVPDSVITYMAQNHLYE
ncbi:nicotinamide/nicotinic acid mononucleotide adenylyltransferase 1 [Pelomyxa schiedti]|nr:nicotinamide/nicotinic acid mononucleotide adenylyltransferase 1 [Pelomyxa schiedti]